MDNISKDRRSWNMARVRAKNTRPEIIVRSILHRLGFRFRLKQKCLPCRPDILLCSRKIAIFVHGCFWHRHKNCHDATTPKSRTDFWEKKFAINVKRDHENAAALRRLGWRVLVVWECEVSRNPVWLAKKLCKSLGLYENLREFDKLPSKRELMQVAEKRADYIVKARTKSAEH